MKEMVRFEHCSSMWISGQTGSGKTQFVYHFLNNYAKMYTSRKRLVLLWYVHQDVFDEWRGQYPTFKFIVKRYYQSLRKFMNLLIKIKGEDDENKYSGD